LFTYPCTPRRSSDLPLTTSQEHYLKKYLLGVLINNELDRLQKNLYETLPNLGGPFDLKDEHANSTTPFLRYLFESIVVPFPFLTSSRGALWSKLQTFMDEWAKIEAGNGVEREEMIRQKRLKNKGEQTLVLMYSMAIKTVEQRAQEKKDSAARKNSIANNNDIHHKVDSNNHKDLDLDYMEQLIVESNGRDNQHSRVQPDQPQPSPARSRSVSPFTASSTIHGVRINVVGVRIFNVLFITSVCPSVCGWYAVDNASLTSNNLCNSCQNLLVKRLSRSEMMDVGRPCSLKMLSRNWCATSTAVAEVVLCCSDNCQDWSLQRASSEKHRGRESLFAWRGTSVTKKIATEGEGPFQKSTGLYTVGLSAGRGTNVTKKIVPDGLVAGFVSWSQLLE